MQQFRRRGVGVLVLAMALLVLQPTAAMATPGIGQRETVAPPGADDPSAVDLRVLLGRLLGEHAFLVMETMRATALGQELSTALRAALDDNSAQLAGAIATVYGADAGDSFAALWTRHVDLLIDYAEARSRGDQAAADAAEQALDQYIKDFAAFLRAANPQFHPHDEAAALRLHIDQVTRFSDAEYVEAYEAQRAAFSHMFDLGDALALGIARQFPGRFKGGAVAFSPRSNLRLALDQLLAEHLVLAAEAMRAGVTRAPDLEAGTAALAANTADLSKAIAGVYGAAAGDAFQDLWQKHIDAYLSFVTALGSDDDAARDASLMELHAYHDEIARFLASANPNLREEDVAALIRRHVQALISQAEATKAGDEARAVATTREAYAGTFEVGAALADAIAKQFPDRFKDLKALPFTTTVAAPGTSDDRPLVPALLLAVAVAAFAARMRRGALVRER